MASDSKVREKYGNSGHDCSPTGSSETRGSGGTGRVVGTTVNGPMDGPSMGGDIRSRNWDTGQQKGFRGADIAPNKGKATTHPTDARFANPSGKGMPSSTSLGPKEFPSPSTKENPTQASRYGGVEGGGGPKVRGSSVGGNVQKGKTGSTDKTPKGSKNSSGVTGGKSYKGGK